MGESVLIFTWANDFRLVNTFFKKMKEYLIIIKSRNNMTPMNYFIVRRKDFDGCKNCKVMPGECVNSIQNLARRVCQFNTKSHPWYSFKEWGYKVKGTKIDLELSDGI